MSKIFNSELTVRRGIVFVAGLFVLAIGTGGSIVSMLGSGPVAAVPYAINMITGVTFGFATFAFQSLLVVGEAVTLKKFSLWSLLEIAFSFAFGYISNIGLWIIQLFPDPTNFFTRLIYTAVSFTLGGIGVWLYTKADILNMPSEAFVRALSIRLKKPFYKMKIAFDICCVALGLILSMIFLKSMGSVGIGTVIISFLLGSVVGICDRLFGKRLEAWMK